MISKGDERGQTPYCEQHHWVSTNVPHFPIWIVQCSVCERYDNEDMNKQLQAYVNKRVVEAEKDAYQRGYNSGYIGAKRGSVQKGDDALKSYIDSVVDDRIKQLEGEK